MKKLFLAFLLLLIGVPSFSGVSEQLDDLFTEIKFIDQQLNPNLRLWNGIHPQEIYVVEIEEYQAIGEKYQKALDALNAIEDADLSHQERISKAIMRLKIEDELSNIKYKMFLIPFNAEGGFYNTPTYFLPGLAFDSLRDYKSYLQWLPYFAIYIEHHIRLMEKGLEEGILPPKLVVENNILLMKKWTNAQFSTSPFAKPFEKMPDHFSEFERNSLRNDAMRVIVNKIIPSYRKLEMFLKGPYLKGCSESIAVSSIPNGKAYYEDRLAYYATMSLSPDSVFDLGHQEVNRIRAKMEALIHDLNFEGNWDDFLRFLRTDPQFYAKTPRQLIDHAERLSRKAESKLPKYFSVLYQLPFVVEKVPEEIAPNYTSGRYVHGDIKKNKAGKYWVNTFNLMSRTLYTLPALTLHEAVPGHHLQTTIASEIPNLPEFRNLYYISAFGEGWALYCEYLGEEMGMYETSYELFGRYTYEMWRACRLVVDVGIHYKGWSREQAVEFMKRNTALSVHEINTEIDRYIGWPGQAISYKIGEITIKNLREKASKELGDKFDIKEFHHRLLRNGSVTLPVLTEEVELYIEETL